MEKLNYISTEEYKSLRSFLRTLSAENTETARLVASAVRRELTARQALLSEMYFVRQLTMREIAEELGVNPSTVSRTLQTSRLKLRRCLKYASRALLEAEED